MTLVIRPPTESDYPGLHAALDTVARERRYLAFTQAPPTEAAYAFFRSIPAGTGCQFVALRDGEVVGWCDVLPVFGDARAHVGSLGMGVVPGQRRSGVGTGLLVATLAAAGSRFSRIELTVRVDNVGAIALYERQGFITEGIHRRGVAVDGIAYDTQTMARLA